MNILKKIKKGVIGIKNGIKVSAKATGKFFKRNVLKPKTVFFIGGAIGTILLLPYTVYLLLCFPKFACAFIYYTGTTAYTHRKKIMYGYYAYSFINSPIGKMLIFQDYKG